jgi:hypothetical protein
LEDEVMKANGPGAVRVERVFYRSLRHKHAVVKYVCTGDYSIRISSPVTSLIVRVGLIYQVRTLCRYKDVFITHRFFNITLYPPFFPSLPCTAVVPQATVSSTSSLSRLWLHRKIRRDQ